MKTLLAKGKRSARKLKRAQILLAADAGQIDTVIAQTLQVHVNPVERIRKGFVEGGLDHALSENKRPGGQFKLDGKEEAVLVALACSDPPLGRAQWTMQLLADRLVELGVVASISDETVRRHLKKTTSNPGSTPSGAFPKSTRRILRRLEFHYTPVPASWLNMVELEIAALSSQCLARRIDCLSRWRGEIWAWEAQRNANQTTVHWRFTCEVARLHLRLYPS